MERMRELLPDWASPMTMTCFSLGCEGAGGFGAMLSDYVLCFFDFLLVAVIFFSIERREKV